MNKYLILYDETLKKCNFRNKIVFFILGLTQNFLIEKIKIVEK